MASAALAFLIELQRATNVLPLVSNTGVTTYLWIMQCSLPLLFEGRSDSVVCTCVNTKDLETLELQPYTE